MEEQVHLPQEPRNRISIQRGGLALHNMSIGGQAAGTAMEAGRMSGSGTHNWTRGPGLIIDGVNYP